MTAAPRLARNLYPALRQMRWRRWLVVTALICTIGIYSIELTHDHKTTVAELACPACHVLAHGAPNLLKPNLTPVVGHAGWYWHVLPRRGMRVASARHALKPQPRAPPLLAPSLV